MDPRFENGRATGTLKIDPERDFAWKGQGDLEIGKATGSEAPRGRKRRGEWKGHAVGTNTGIKNPKGILAGPRIGDKIF